MGARRLGIAGRRRRLHLDADRVALGALVVFLLIAAPLLLLVIGRHRFFFSDEWGMLAGRDVEGFGDLLRPNNAHWSTIPALSYSVVWRIAGLRSYLPYQAVLIGVHASIVLLLHLVMRRSGVHPWLAAAAAAALVLFGPGGDNIIWAFQIGFTGSIAFGLAHLLLATGDEPVPRGRDGLGLLAGLASLMCSGVGTVMVPAVALAVLIRRGWRAAVLHGVPLAATYGLYVTLADPQTGSPAGRPSAATVVEWVWHGTTGVFTGIGRYPVLVFLLVALTVGGLLLMARSLPLAELRRRLAGPVALAGAALVFSASTALGRWQFGTEAARSSRYLYVGAALTLPLIALGAEAVRARWKPALLVAAAALLVPIPGNATAFEGEIYSSAYFDQHRRVIYHAPRVAFADEVPRDVRPLPNPFIIDEVNIGYLLDLQRAGKLRDDTAHVSRRTEEELRVRLGVAQRHGPAASTGCERRTEPLRLRPERGTTYVLTGNVDISTVDGTARGAPPVAFRPVNGQQLTIELAGLDLVVRRGVMSPDFEWCDPLATTEETPREP